MKFCWRGNEGCGNLFNKELCASKDAGYLATNEGCENPSSNWDGVLASFSSNWDGVPASTSS